MLKTQSAGGVVVNEREEVVLVVNGPTQFWGFPKGHLEDREEPLAAALREVAEETGIERVDLLGSLGSYERFKGKIGGGDDTSELKRIHMFLFLTEEETLAPHDAANPEARWFAFDMVAETLTHPKDKEFFAGANETIRSLLQARPPR